MLQPNLKHTHGDKLSFGVHCHEQRLG